MRVIKDDNFQTVKLYRETEGYTDPETGNWIPAGEQLIAAAEMDIQPKSGQQRANELQTEYESDYIGYVGAEDIIFETGYSEILQGDIVEDETGQQYVVVFPGNWQSHYEIDLKAK